MTEKTALPPEVTSELYQARNIIGLAVFAVEARRVLTELELVAEIFPDMRRGLGQIEARRQWTEYPQTLDLALNDVYDRLGRLVGKD